MVTISSKNLILLLKILSPPFSQTPSKISIELPSTNPKSSCLTLPLTDFSLSSALTCLQELLQRFWSGSLESSGASVLKFFSFSHIPLQRVHEFNIDATLIAFLPYHDSTSFSKILQLLNLPPASSSNKYSFLLPVKKSHQALQRSILLRAIKSDHEVLKLVSQSLPSALEVVSTHRPLSSFWTITLLEYIQQARKIQDGELTTLYASIRATLRNKSSKDAQYAARMVFVVLAQKMPLGDKLLTSLMVSMLKALKDDKKIDSEVDQILLTLFAIIDAQGVQIAHEDYAKRVLSIQ